MILGVHWIDFAIVMAYFAVVLYVGVYQGGRRTKTLGDFFVAGGKWGPLISFIFVFASAVAGNEAVVVGGQAYESGLSGVWYWWSFLFATPVYFLFSTYFRRARVYNIAEFFEMRYTRSASALYAVIAGVICILFIGMFVLAIGKILVGLTTLNQQQCVWIITLIVGAYVFSGGMMSTLLTDVLQGLMCLFILSFILLPFLWVEAGGWDALQQYSAEHPHLWDLADPEKMTIWTVLALNLSALVGGIAAPWIYNWIAVSKNERAATQCGWGHLWKRIITLLFAIYGILFAIYQPGLKDPEQSWGIVMGKILPVGVLGLLIASFFAAAMSSAATFATTSSAMVIDYLYRRVLRRDKDTAHYLRAARLWVLVTVLLAALSTHCIDSIQDYVKLALTLLSFLGIPIYFGVAWRRANCTGMWMSLVGGIATYLTVVGLVMATQSCGFVAAIKPAFVPAVFCSTSAALVGMILGSLLGRGDDPLKLKRFHVIMHTPVGKEQRLVEAGIRLPSMIDAGLVPAGPEQIDVEAVERLYEQDSRDKIFGAASGIELCREPDLPWYFPGFIKIVFACVALVVGTWLLTRILFVW
ncbi:MAG: sodium:solute symporter family protein [Pirellulales bacterium]|nr:sodium:solute symporter family protein [Pirellulales bacterium]